MKIVIEVTEGTDGMLEVCCEYPEMDTYVAAAAIAGLMKEVEETEPRFGADLIGLLESIESGETTVEKEEVANHE